MSAKKQVEGAQYGESSQDEHRASGYNYPDSFYSPPVPQHERTAKTDAAAQKAVAAEVEHERKAVTPELENKAVVPETSTKSKGKARKGKGK